MRLWGWWRSRLYLQIYLAFLGIVVVFALVAAVVFVAFDDDEQVFSRVNAAERIVSALLPPPAAGGTELNAALQRWHEELDLDLTVLAARGAVLGTVGEPLQWPERDAGKPAFLRVRSERVTAGVRLRDGRRALVSYARAARRHWMLVLLLLVGVIALGAHPLAKRITRRLERLRVRVEQLGEGDLSTRVEVEGRDEVAKLAGSFNASAARIQALVGAQTSVLAGASHELRSPLARIRMAIELLEPDSRPDLVERMRKDIGELDALIEELLAASRFQVSSPGREQKSEVDLLALAGEEAARVGARVSGESVMFRGEARWLVRMIRNLLENARRHSGATHIEVTVRSRAEGGAVVTVEDDGGGVPEALRERVFEPFYRPPGMREGHDRGVGLGLALVRQIAERHGGSARCEANPGGGSRFVVELG